MAELTIEPEAEAEAELKEAAHRHEESVPGLGLDFLLEMRRRTLEAAEARSPIRSLAESQACAAHTPLVGFRTSSFS